MSPTVLWSPSFMHTDSIDTSILFLTYSHSSYSPDSCSSAIIAHYVAYSDTKKELQFPWFTTQFSAWCLPLDQMSIASGFFVFPISFFSLSPKLVFEGMQILLSCSALLVFIWFIQSANDVIIHCQVFHAPQGGSQTVLHLQFTPGVINPTLYICSANLSHLMCMGKLGVFCN